MERLRFGRGTDSAGKYFPAAEHIGLANLFAAFICTIAVDVEWEKDIFC